MKSKISDTAEYLATDIRLIALVKHRMDEERKKGTEKFQEQERISKEKEDSSEK